MQDTLTTDLTERATKENWDEENVQNLAHHFHELKETSEGARYARVNRFDIEDISGFNTIRKDIEGINIVLALEKENKKKVTFCPYLHVETKDTKEYSFYLKPRTDIPQKPSDQKLTSAEVPAEFKNTICKNWYELETHLIDDLFHCNKKNNSSNNDDEALEYIVRVQYFIISNDMVRAIADNTKDVSEIILYPGVDMNKFNNKNKISFTPVLGVKPALDFGSKQMMSLTESYGNETYIEYSKPCPPTCSL